MKVIQTLNDLEWLKATQAEPEGLVQAIEQDFLLLFEAESECDDVLTFRLPNQEALILLESGDDVRGMFEQSFMDLEYVERHKEGEISFFRLAKRTEHQFQLLYSEEGTHDEETENWLAEHAEWNEGIGDFDV
ncbi:hypothetical protein EU245_14800 [Lentibacillus lipolyticus]|nr:hypothetical protein EU245_14800 [Lentibacillus lipolyticus]